tara:strand:+ start:300 stop:494 length:195 start_codon:yes stop_codon:yes gene_type:complete
MNRVQLAKKRNIRVRVKAGHVLAPCDGLYVRAFHHADHLPLRVEVLSDEGRVFTVHAKDVDIIE